MKISHRALLATFFLLHVAPPARALTVPLQARTQTGSPQAPAGGGGALTPGPYAVGTGEYKLPAGIDTEVLPGAATELWARVFWPQDMHKKLPAEPEPLVVFLHGNHGTCGTGSQPRVDQDCTYTLTGRCDDGYVVVPNHEGFNYAGRLLASWGYVVVSINANLGITCGAGVMGDDGLILARGRLVLRHLETWSDWIQHGGAPNSLGLGSNGWLHHVDLGRVGFVGHSRGGEGVRAGYQLYLDPGSPWPARIPGLRVRGIFEIGSVDQQSSRTFDADNTAWNQLLPMCDGDVSDLQGRMPFERMLNRSTEIAPSSKSLLMVWGANHNFFNTEWQEEDSDGCQGYTGIYGNGIASPAQQTIAAASLLNFFNHHLLDPPVGQPMSAALAAPSAWPTFDAVDFLNPLSAVPNELAQLTPIERDFIPTFDQKIDLPFDGFEKPAGINSSGEKSEAQNVSLDKSALDKPSSLKIGWASVGPQNFFQDNWTSPGQGRDATSFNVLDFRLGVPLPMQDPITITSFDLSIAVVDAENRISTSVRLKSYLDFKGPGNGHTLTFNTVRIPTTDFGDFDWSHLRGVRLIFDQTPHGEIVLANIRLSRAAPGLLTRARAAKNSPLTLVGDASIRTRQHRASWVGTAAPFPPDGSWTNGQPYRHDSTSTIPETKPGSAFVEVTIASPTPFPVSDLLPTLVIGDRRFQTSRFIDGKLHQLAFQIPRADFERWPQNSISFIQYGSRGRLLGRDIWILPSRTQ